MKIFVVNILYNEENEPDSQVTRVFKKDTDGTMTEIQKEQVLYEKGGVVVLMCADENSIMGILQERISDKITNFEIAQEFIVTEPEPGVMGVMTMGEGEADTEGIIIFQSGV